MDVLESVGGSSWNHLIPLQSLPWACKGRDVTSGPAKVPRKNSASPYSVVFTFLSFYQKVLRPAETATYLLQLHKARSEVLEGKVRSRESIAEGWAGSASAEEVRWPNDTQEHSNTGAQAGLEFCNALLQLKCVACSDSSENALRDQHPLCIFISDRRNMHLVDLGDLSDDLDLKLSIHASLEGEMRRCLRHVQEFLSKLELVNSRLRYRLSHNKRLGCSPDANPDHAVRVLLIASWCQGTDQHAGRDDPKLTWHQKRRHLGMANVRLVRAGEFQPLMQAIPNSSDLLISWPGTMLKRIAAMYDSELQIKQCIFKAFDDLATGKLFRPDRLPSLQGSQTGSAACTLCIAGRMESALPAMRVSLEGTLQVRCYLIPAFYRCNCVHWSRSLAHSDAIQQVHLTAWKKEPHLNHDLVRSTLQYLDAELASMS